MNNTSRQGVPRAARARPTQRGIARFEVVGLDADRGLICGLARRLTENDAEAARLRTTIAGALGAEPPRTGGILAALRRSPLVGADLDL